MRSLVLSGGGTGPEIAGATAAVPARADLPCQLGSAERDLAGFERLGRRSSTTRNFGKAAALG